LGRRIHNTEIAEAVGVTVQTIGRWMHNDVTKFEAPVIERLCVYLNCDIADLLYLEREEEQ